MSKTRPGLARPEQVGLGYFRLGKAWLGLERNVGLGRSCFKDIL